MTERERIETLVAGGTPDRVPWFADMGYWHGAHQERGDLDPAYKDFEGLVRLHREIGVGIYLSSPGLCTVETSGVERTEERSGDEILSKLHTPAGTLLERRQRLPLSNSWAYVERMVKRPADLKVVRWIAEHQTVEPDWAEFVRADEQYRDLGIPFAYIPRTGLAQLMVQWMGVQAGVYAIADAPEEFARSVEALNRALDPVIDLFAASPAKMMIFTDNLSSEIQSPPLFRQYSLPFYERWLSRLHGAGKWVCVHVDGTLRGLLHIFGTCGMDGVESVTPAPVGDLSPDAIRDEAGDCLVLWGGAPGAIFSPIYPEKVFRERILEWLALRHRSPRLVLGAADQIPPDADLDRVQRVREIVEEHGRY